MEYTHCKAIIVFLVLHSILTVNSNTCHTREGECCIKCNPGYRLLVNGRCGKCSKCPQGSYTDQPSSKPTCDLCTKCEGIFQYKEQCSGDRNAVCKCIKGKRCVGENCKACANIICPQGQELVGEECLDCPHGTFKPEKEGKCRPWKSCSAEGSLVLFNGNTTFDVVCGSESKNSGTTTSTKATTTQSPTVTNIIRKTEDNSSRLVIAFIAVPIVAFVCSLLFLIPYIVKGMKKMKNEFHKIPVQIEKIAKEEDGCSCHFPEEEEGEEVMIQHP
ncbi:tumor necrosis factor receptor superfamily member 9 [Bombina bombina]|uniref:tumor necrosis factor receptor superfamily member 9 n=1 Tax=Bombina bombina TaxID=8345 RepID=UPI00235B2603|nr:tumor necrosis factor receptor superfamily member 9 [Bombina bombina]